LTIHTFTSREFNQDVSRAKKAATEGPVFITDRGQPAHVLLSIEEYQRPTSTGQSIVDLLAMPGAEDIEFEPPRVRGATRPADLD
jgi:prevent-host-death family protein